MEPRRTTSPESAMASDIFDKFCSANTLKGILGHYRQLCSLLRLKPTHFPDFYPRLKSKLSSWRAQGLWTKFEKRASQKCYGRGKICYGTRVLIIGAGPCGLRAAIEAQLLGAKVVVVEKRDRISRNNVLHLWPFVIADLKALGAKKFYGKFCAGSIDHISIRQLQCILLKVALLLGVEVHEGVSFEGLMEPTENEGWRATISPKNHPVSHYNFDVLIGADGRRNTLDGFKRKALRAKLAIAITANFINKHTEAEARVKEISGVSYIFNQKFFQDLCEATGIDLENIVYYKDETHYFVMTAKKQSLLNKGVLLEDYTDTAKLLSHENISTEQLMVYALEAATFATDYQLPDIEFAVNHYGQPDVAMFDFTAMYAAENACRVIQKKGHRLLMTLVGDSLLEPFWPTGSGCARGFLSSFDACWMLRSWSVGTKSVLEVIAERESIYRLLGQTTPENLHKEPMVYTIDPHTRYPNLNLRLVMPFQVKSLLETDEVIVDSIEDNKEQIDKLPKKRRRDSIIAIDSLLNWLRDQVSCYDLEIIDVREAFVRGDILCAVIHRFRPDLIEFPLPEDDSVDSLVAAAFHNQLAFDILSQEYGVPVVMSGVESVQYGCTDFLKLVTYLSQIYEIFKGEIPQTKYSKSEYDEDDEHYDVGQKNYLKGLRMAVTAKHHFTQKPSRKSRLSSSRDVDSEPYRKGKKRKSDERNARTDVSESSSYKFGDAQECVKLQDRIHDIERFIRSMRLLQLEDDSERNCEDYGLNDDFTLHLYRQTVPDFDERCKVLEQKLSGREVKTVFGKISSTDSEKMVPGLAKNLEDKFRERHVIDKQKPKDMIRAIGKIDKTDWNIQRIERKMAENKDKAVGKKERENKVPRWSREAYDDKREAMKRKMDGINSSQNENIQTTDETVKNIGNRLKHGNSLDVGQRGSNKVSAMAEQLIHKLERPKQPEIIANKPLTSKTSKPVFELPSKGRIDLCHFCKERVYVVERMTAEGKFFHRNCFRCEYCNTSLRIGNYVYDREGRYGEKFYCPPHYNIVKMYGWKKFDCADNAEKYSADQHLLSTPNRQILNDMDERGTTPERVEFENDCASDDENLNEMDEDEWTHTNFGASNTENTSDEASELSDDEVTPGGYSGEANARKEEDRLKKDTESSGSETEVPSDDEDQDSYDNEEEEEDDEDDEEEDEYDEDCGGSATEIETDSEFADDPPNVTVPGSIPTIIVDAPEQHVTKMFDTGTLNHAKHVYSNREAKKVGHKNKLNQETFKDLLPNDEDEVSIELIKKGGPERQLPVVTPVPKKWEPLSNDDKFMGKNALDLKKKLWVGGSIPPVPSNLTGFAKKATEPAAHKQVGKVLDMISEQQKLLQPAKTPSASMQAFLEGAEKLKNKNSILSINHTMSKSLTSSSSFEKEKSPLQFEKRDNGNNIPPVPVELSLTHVEKKDSEKDNSEHSLTADCLGFTVTITECSNVDADSVTENFPVTGVSDAPSISNSETETRSTVVNATDYKKPECVQTVNSQGEDANSGSDTEVGSAEPYSDSDDVDYEEMIPLRKKLENPPRVEIEDEFGVTKLLENCNKSAELKLHDDGISSSSSSINSGFYLETELSEYTKDDSGNERKQCIKRKPTIKKQPHNDQVPCDVNPKIALSLDLENFAYADSDEFSVSDVSEKKSQVVNDRLEPDSLETNLVDNSGYKPEIKRVSPAVETFDPAKEDARCTSVDTDDSDRKQGISLSSAEDQSAVNTYSDSLENPITHSTSHNENLYSDYIVPSNKPRKGSSPGKLGIVPQDLDLIQVQGSPGTTRKLHEIHQERAKQSDLIKSLVMDFIRRSPDKITRKSSKGAIIPLSSGNGDKTTQDCESRPSSDSSRCQDDTSEECEKFHVGSKTYSATFSSSDASSSNDIPHQPMKESSTSSDGSSTPSEISLGFQSKPHSHYKPVFTQSPRFRHRNPNHSMGVRISSTEPNTPTQPTQSVLPSEPVTSSDTNNSSPQESNVGITNPLFHSSLPNLSYKHLINISCKPTVTAVQDMKENNGRSFLTNENFSAVSRNDPFLVAKTTIPCQSKIDPVVSVPDLKDDFVNLHLKFKSTEDSRDSDPARYSASSSYYSDSGYFHSQPNSAALGDHSDCLDNSAGTSWKTNFGSRPRANTVADLVTSNDNLKHSHGITAKDSSPSPETFSSNEENHKTTKSKSLSSDTLLDAATIEKSACRGTSVPDIRSHHNDRVPAKQTKGKDRERRKSLIQTVSEFFRSSNGSDKSPVQSLTTSTSSSSIVSPTKDKFSIFKSKLLQGKDKKIGVKPKTQTDNKGAIERSNCNKPQQKTDYSAYSARESISGQLLHNSSPSIVFKDSNRGTDTVDPCMKSTFGYRNVDRKKSPSAKTREMDEIQLQLESIEEERARLELKGVKIEKRLRGEDEEDDDRSEKEILEEWFVTVRETTKLARFEKELLCRAKELELESREEQLEAQLQRLNIQAEEMDKADINRLKPRLINELERVQEERMSLQKNIHQDMERYEAEDTQKVYPPFFSTSSSRLESDV